MKAGFGVGVITPPPPVYLAGFGARTQPAESAHDDLEARVLCLQDGDVRLCLVVCDLLGMTAEYSAPVRDAVGSALGIGRESVLTSCTHTHSGPSAMGGTERIGWPTPEAFREVLVAGCAAAAADAADALEDASLAFATAPLPRGVSLNRRGHPYRPIFGVLDVLRPGGSRVGVVANVGIHPVSLGPGWLAVSCDWPRPCREEIESVAGGTAILMSAALGDVNPSNSSGYEVEGGSWERTSYLGRAIAGHVLDAMGSAAPVEGPVRIVRHETITVPVSRTNLTALAGNTDDVAVELVEWALGGVRVVSLPGEAFHAFGGEVAEARGGQALLAGLAPTWQGYLPLPFNEGGYEEGLSYGEDAVKAILAAIVAGG
jgi:hypothetical protein